VPIGIRYEWVHEGDRAQAQELVRAMHAIARELPFEHVGEIIEDEWSPIPGGNLDPNREPGAPLTEAEWERLRRRDLGHFGVTKDNHLSILFPLWTCGFTVRANACKPFGIGMGEHELETTIEYDDEPWVSFPTNLGGKVVWSHWVETCYASLPQNGGWDNFARQHLLVLTLLERIEKLGLKVNVRDDGRYWETASLEALREELERDLRVTAYACSYLRAFIGDDPDAASQNPILLHPDFERLAEEGSKLITIVPYTEEE
jgi:hypothetical protein